MPVKRVFSAGGIVLRLTPFAQDESSKKSEVKVLVTQHSGHKGWDFPKGHLEVAESSEDAAVREVEEETGVRAEVLEKAGQTQYFYYDSGEKYFKTVNYFFMKYLGEGEATTAFEVADKKWLPVDKVESQLTFKTTKEMWEIALKRMEQLTLRLRSGQAINH